MNENSRHMLDMGVDVGCPDLLISKCDSAVLHFLYLEIKTKTGTLSQAQKTWNEKFDSEPCSNASRAVAYGYQDGITIINNWLLRMGA